MSMMLLLLLPLVKVGEAKKEKTRLVDVESGAPKRGRAKGRAKGTFAVKAKTLISLVVESTKPQT